MKYFILIGLLNLNIACGNKKQPNVKTFKNDKILKSINDSLVKETVDSIKIIKKVNIESQNVDYYEDSIEESILNMFNQKDIKIIDDKLNLVSKDSKIPLQDKTYWVSYLLYYKTIFYKSFLKKDDAASSTIDLAIEKLEKNPITSEDFALLASCKSYSIQFANMTQLAKISGEVIENANKALELNSKNIRAYYVLASNNFYTPKMFGGMTKVEEYALKGLACPNSSELNSYSPYWGKPRLYEIFIKYLTSENRVEDASKYKELAKKEFPNQF